MGPLFRVRDVLNRLPVSFAHLLMRIGVGSVFFTAGLLKYQSWDMTLMLFRDEYKVPLLPPDLAARIAMGQELTLPVLLFVGLGTRIAALPLLGMIGVIQVFVYPSAWVEHLVWASILLFLLMRGPGALSLDHLVARWCGGQNPPGDHARRSGEPLARTSV
ncbi:MAG: DoxX family protein [Acidobacteriota bacterium]